MRSPQKRIGDYEADMRRRQPLIEKMIMRSRSILSECDKLTPEERIIVSRRMAEIAEMLRQPAVDREPSVLKKANVPSSRGREITGQFSPHKSQNHASKP
jgi:hypothetical protein